MTIAADATANAPRLVASGAARGRSWRGSLAEFLLVGGVTPLLFPLSWLLRRTLGLDPAELAVGFLMFHAAFVVNDPHFAVTYLLFYRGPFGRALQGGDPPMQRARALVAGLIVPLALGVWGVGALASRSAFALGLMIQLMFFLVGWHYVKQGFGVLVVLAARQGVRFQQGERLVILAHCFAGWAYAWANPADAGTEVEEKGVVYTTIAHGPGLERVTLVVLLATAVALVVVLVRKRLREGRLPIVTPLTAMLCSIWSWSIYSSVDPLVVYVVPALHSAQYLYFVWLLRSGEARERQGPPWFETSARTRLAALAASAIALGWVLFHGAPTLLDDLFVPRHTRLAALPLGPTPCFAALYTFVNVHHFFMDWVIWRRENPESRYLVGAVRLGHPSG
jgi:hypothetical protein